MRIPDWLPSVVCELREVSSALLEAGLNRSSPFGKSGPAGPNTRALLRTADEFISMLPTAVEDVIGETGEHAGGPFSKTPRSATPSRSPQDYQLSGNRLLPIRWVGREWERAADRPALRWLMGLSRALGIELSRQQARLERQVEEALLVRAGESHWASADADSLRAINNDVLRRIAHLAKAEARISLGFGQRTLTPSERPPNPYPHTACWNRLRPLAIKIRNPNSMLGLILGDLFTEPIAMADVPFLYQRWCGLQIIEQLTGMGWECTGDVVGSLFLGGRLEFTNAAGGLLTLWVEPRVSRTTAAALGCRCVFEDQELTPDFLFVTGPIGKRDIFVLDATLSTNPELLTAKYGYLNDLVAVDTRIVAGVPVSRRLMRAWAVCPSKRPICDLGDPEGRTGHIPLHPSVRYMGPLRDWTNDVAAHALAAALVA